MLNYKNIYENILNEVELNRNNKRENNRLRNNTNNMELVRGNIYENNRLCGELYDNINNDRLNNIREYNEFREENSSNKYETIQCTSNNYVISNCNNMKINFMENLLYANNKVCNLYYILLEKYQKKYRFENNIKNLIEIFLVGYLSDCNYGYSQKIIKN